LKQNFGGVFIANQGFTAADATAEIAAGRADAVAWGKAFIANPDLPRRLREGAPLNAPVPESFYGGDERGYTDYPALAS
jgi:2,4-dienoyl-CoA reductase-like NADH-dependent reductase (Old Yellow Enzyme family)